MVKQHLEREGKFMETYKATVINKGDDWFLVLTINENKMKIPLTRDEPLEIKTVFNKLIMELKEREFEFKAQDLGKDLFSQIAKVYIEQLNSELRSVFKELSDYDLVKKSSN